MKKVCSFFFGLPCLWRPLWIRRYQPQRKCNCGAVNDDPLTTCLLSKGCLKRLWSCIFFWTNFVQTKSKKLTKNVATFSQPLLLRMPFSWCLRVLIGGRKGCHWWDSCALQNIHIALSTANKFSRSPFKFSRSPFLRLSLSKIWDFHMEQNYKENPSQHSVLVPRNLLIGPQR